MSAVFIAFLCYFFDGRQGIDLVLFQADRFVVASFLMFCCCIISNVKDAFRGSGDGEW